jgi:hypothetical protein
VTVKVSLSPDTLAMRPGERADVEVTVQNAGSAVEHFAPSIVGLPDEVCRFEPSVVKLRPGESGTIRAHVALPDRSSLVDGVYTLGVLVRSPYQGSITRCEELRVDVLPVPGLSMTAHPEVAVGGGRAAYALSVTNEGNTALAVSLHASEPEAAVGFAFRPRSIEVPAGATASATVAVDARRPWTGQEHRRPITLRAVGGPDLEAQQVVTFIQRPRVRGGLMRLVGMATGVSVLAGASIGAALLTRARQEATHPTGNASAAVTPGAPSAAPSAPVPSVPPSAAASLPPSPSGPVVAGTTIVDFTKLPGGGAPGDRIIPADLYSDAGGITLETVLDNAPAACQDATALALRTVKTVSFLTSARPAGVDLCNVMPIRMTLKSPARSVTLTYVGTGKQYALSVEFADGTTKKVGGTAASGVAAPLTVKASGSPIASLVFGHTNTDPNTKEPTKVRKLVYQT